MYNLQSDELLFYIELISTKYSLDISNIDEMVRIFNEELELPISKEEITLVLENPLLFEEGKQLLTNF